MDGWTVLQYLVLSFLDYKAHLYMSRIRSITNKKYKPQISTLKH